MFTYAIIFYRHLIVFVVVVIFALVAGGVRLCHHSQLTLVLLDTQYVLIVVERYQMHLQQVVVETDAFLGLVKLVFRGHIRSGRHVGALGTRAA